MRKLALFAARADFLCGRLNDGLAAVALVLAVLTVAVSTMRSMEAVGPIDAEWLTIDTKN
jgi:hypothetical protein